MRALKASRADKDAREWKHLLQRARSGDPLSAHAIGEHYRDGSGSLPRDPIAATAWFLRAAQLGHAPSQYETGHAYEFDIGVQANRAVAIHWYRKAAEQGHTEGQFRLGFLLVNDEFEEAKRWLHLAAENEHVGAQVLTGIAAASFQNLKDDAVKQWWRTAVAWFVQAADAGDREAAFWLGNYIEDYCLTEWVAEDYGPERGHPVHWWHRAAELGDPRGALRLAKAHRYGNDVPEDAAQAFAWYRRAAEGGDEVAMREVGLAFLHGRGVHLDEAHALIWLQKAVAVGDSEALEAIERLRSSHPLAGAAALPHATPSDVLLDALRPDGQQFPPSAESEQEVARTIQPAQVASPPHRAAHAPGESRSRSTWTLVLKCLLIVGWWAFWLWGLAAIMRPSRGYSGWRASMSVLLWFGLGLWAFMEMNPTRRHYRRR